MAVVSQVLETVLTLNASRFGAGIGQASRDMDRLQGRMDSFGRGSAIAGAVAAAGFALLGKAALEAGEDTASFNRAVGAFHGAFPRAEMEAFTDKLQRIVGIENDMIARTVGVLGTFGATADEAKNLTLGIYNTAEAMKFAGVTAEGLATQIGKALESGEIGRVGKTLGIDADAFKNADRLARMTMIMDALARKGGDAAAVFRNTLPGAIQAFNTEIQSAFGNVGKALDGPGASMLNWLISMIQKFNDAGPVVHGAAAAIGVTLVLGAAAAAIGLKALEIQNTRLFNAMLKTTAAAKVQGDTLAATGAKAAAGGAGGFLGKILPFLAAGAAAAAAGGAFGSATEKATGAPAGVSWSRWMTDKLMAEQGHPEKVTNPASRKALGLPALGGATAETAQEKLVRLAEAQLAEAKKTNENLTGRGGGAVSTSDVPLYRQLAARQVRVFGS